MKWPAFWRKKKGTRIKFDKITAKEIEDGLARKRMSLFEHLPKENRSIRALDPVVAAVTLGPKKSGASSDPGDKVYRKPAPRRSFINAISRHSQPPVISNRFKPLPKPLPLAKPAYPLVSSPLPSPPFPYRSHPELGFPPIPKVMADSNGDSPISHVSSEPYVKATDFPLPPSTPPAMGALSRRATESTFISTTSKSMIASSAQSLNVPPSPPPLPDVKGLNIQKKTASFRASDPNLLGRSKPLPSGIPLNIDEETLTELSSSAETRPRYI